MRVARAGRGFGVVLHREHRPAVERMPQLEPSNSEMWVCVAPSAGRLVDRKAVVHRGDLDLAGGLVLDRMIGAVMALMHLHGLGADREPSI
jgi:hypothetical protein